MPRARKCGYFLSMSALSSNHKENMTPEPHGIDRVALIVGAVSTIFAYLVAWAALSIV